jgi:serine/threonine protein kinase
MDGYRIVKRLGEGGFGQVVLAQTRSTKQVSTGFLTISMRAGLTLSWWPSRQSREGPRITTGE